MTRVQRSERLALVKDMVKSLLLLVAATGVGMVFKKMDLSDSNVVMAYIIGVLLTAVVTSKKIYSLISSVVSVLAFNYFFTVPYFTLKAYSDDYPVTFLTMFLSAFITSTLAVQMKQQMRASAEVAFRTQILLETNQMVQQKSDRREMVSVVAGQLVRLLNRDIVVYLMEESGLSDAFWFPARLREGEESLEKKMLLKAEYTSPGERTVAEWVCRNKESAGASTNQMSDAVCMHLPIRSGDKVYGVVAIPVPGPEGELEPFENSITLSILGECALALEKEEALRAREASALLAKNEQLRANLLRSISHDLRTPLTSISGNAGILLANADDMDGAGRRLLYENIYDDSLWLINLVENLLSVTRIEDGTMQLHLSTELIDEVITEALQHVNRKKEEHVIKVHPSDEFLLVKMDAKLIMQVIVNIVDNAVKYTPPGSEIHISTFAREKNVVVEIADNGNGIPDDAKERIFDRFYVVENGVVDSRRSLGLGLSLCRSIITAHGGEITVSDNIPKGALFRFTLPEEEVTLRE